MKSLIKSAAFAAATAGAFLGVGAAPAIAAPMFHAPVVAGVETGAAATAEHRRERRDYRYDSGNRRYDSNRRAHRDNRSWRGRDGRYYCRRDNGTTGLVVGGAVGGLAGHEIAGRGDRTLGTILGVAGGALLGREIDRGSGRRCR